MIYWAKIRISDWHSDKALPVWKKSELWRQCYSMISWQCKKNPISRNSELHKPWTDLKITQRPIKKQPRDFMLYTYKSHLVSFINFQSYGNGRNCLFKFHLRNSVISPRSEPLTTKTTMLRKTDWAHIALHHKTVRPQDQCVWYCVCVCVLLDWLLD